MKSPAASIGRPASRSPRPIPISSGASTEPTVSVQPQVCRQAGAANLPRNSKDTPRTISAASSSHRARYSAENQLAYQLGKAANIDAPATISQTSLPSQNGPIELMATRRSVSVRPTTLCRAPTPKSNPSRTKKPVQKNATITNQTVGRVIGPVLSTSARGSVRQRPRAGPG